MQKWIQKFLVASVAVITLGVITPSHAIWEGILDHNSNAKAQFSDNPTSQQTKYIETQYETVISTEDETSFEDYAFAAAKEQAYLKFGSRVGPQISSEFDDVIFPKIQEAIEMTVQRLDDETTKSLGITENPSGNYAEKIFHVFNTASGQDLIRFHVRTENRPFEGYYYNFHYHTYEDNFTAHNNLGEIYWSKNTPPKWLS
ncbi:YpjP family protein [Viridibacillus sp. YIM B01967]|uniref:YpjP family protein n=1 Tax=Viridibacillus soli TaxID=2798301 RepID=A0ABS1H6S0_9BACL|nr:YpjP family protein [Viridibacillus soli]MBK3495107.1 YpjP family protein [Viridibacillus soli]